ncbi:type 2 periplasmic-binding domain-containing protein [Paenibacillus cymbidii]|uniref:ABC transporter substrate-binding protein n=1 Tax=Paenibacillus cymbidii TaxID=1639034 RepID=UPI0010815D1A|nr:ABC transporter substrate-binding protein [Paenibacillus cymbidii]
MIGTKNSRHRVLTAGLALALVGTSAACSSGGKESGASATPPAAAGSSASAVPTATAAKTLEISWVGANARGKVEDNNYVQQKLEAKFNVKLKNKKVDVNNRDQVNLMLASGELPEATFFSANDAKKLYADGVSRAIPKDMILRYAPNYARMLDENPPGWQMSLVPGKTDQYLSLIGIAQSVEGLNWGTVYRLDWLEKLGIKPKGNLQPVGTTGVRPRIFFTDQAFTLEEEAKIFDAMVNQDPDGNGKKDTYAFTPYNDTFSWWAANYMGAFGLGVDGAGTGFDMNLEENGKLMTFNTSTKYKDFLTLMADWYKKGYIDPEFVTLNRAKAWEKFSTGKIGSAQAAYNAASQPIAGRPPGNLLDKDPNAKILLTPPEIGYNGQQGAAAYRPVSLLGGYDFIIRKDVSDEKLIRILQMFDYLNYDKEGVVMSRFGELGTHFNWEGEPYNSAALPINGSNADDKFGLGYYNFGIISRQLLTYQTPKDVMKLVNDYFFNKDKGMKLMIQPARFDLFKETMTADLIGKYGEKLKTMTDEYLLKSITGEVGVASTWDDYVTRWNSSGGNEIMAELGKAPKTADLLKK